MRAIIGVLFVVVACKSGDKAEPPGSAPPASTSGTATTRPPFDDKVPYLTDELIEKYVAAVNDGKDNPYDLVRDTDGRQTSNPLKKKPGVRTEFVKRHGFTDDLQYMAVAQRILKAQLTWQFNGTKPPISEQDWKLALAHRAEIDAAEKARDDRYNAAFPNE